MGLASEREISDMEGQSNEIIEEQFVDRGENLSYIPTDLSDVTSNSDLVTIFLKIIELKIILDIKVWVVFIHVNVM